MLKFSISSFGLAAKTSARKSVKQPVTKESWVRPTLPVIKDNKVYSSNKLKELDNW